MVCRLKVVLLKRSLTYIQAICSSFVIRGTQVVVSPSGLNPIGDKYILLHGASAECVCTSVYHNNLDM
jgi:hypothetical protein